LSFIHKQINGNYLGNTLELGLVLGDQPLTRTVISLTSTPAAELGLITLEVRIVLHKLHESHGLLSSEEDGSAERHSIREMLGEHETVKPFFSRLKK
jgi:hypothetical protein